ncbi:hypothetical protein FALBO_15100 [Fusarium albosuccineum]|uniref:Uncharacterized protein n=1 Tax=Fusarium albosuccineum TaxID=1237068 RepID=A0A8H4KYK2_9HYPO|nr:hypothetical protein FALBO_15100 [Fusarium albosuccineum]
MVAEKATTTRSGLAASTTSPISPPCSPPSSCHAFQPARPQPVDMLASQLRTYSLEQYQYGSNIDLRMPPPPVAALSPVSLPDDDFVNVRSVLGQHGSGAMDIDTEFDAGLASDTTRLDRQGSSISSSSSALTPLSEISSIARSSPIAVDPTVLETQSHNSQTTYGPDFDDISHALEVDEGYCEDDDDFSWMESATSLRLAGTPGGIKKRYGLRYRTSSEAASRCSNAIHSVPRMRRRDKKKKKQHKPIDPASEGSEPGTSKTVVSVQ